MLQVGQGYLLSPLIRHRRRKEQRTSIRTAVPGEVFYEVCPLFRGTEQGPVYYVTGPGVQVVCTRDGLNGASFFPSSLELFVSSYFMTITGFPRVGRLL